MKKNTYARTLRQGQQMVLFALEQNPRHALSKISSWSICELSIDVLNHGMVELTNTSAGATRELPFNDIP
ncbi:MAG TPA: hypothetical protein VJ022_05165 [Anaerolineales bacterium]|nr:hypothetical protein [Anaerolineales bacterium]